MNYIKIAEIRNEFVKNMDKSVILKAFETFTEKEKIILIGSITDMLVEIEPDYSFEKENQKLLTVIRNEKILPYVKILKDILKNENSIITLSDEKLSWNEFYEHLIKLEELI